MNACRFPNPQLIRSLSKSTTRAYTIIALAAIVSLTGCRLCDNSEDLAYPTYGGAWQRTVRDQGRVGSLFDPAGAKASELVSRDTPISADELERSRHDGSNTPKYSEDEDDSSKDTQEDSSDNDESQGDDNRNGDSTEDGESTDSDIEERKRKLREKDLEVKIVPGDPLPPLLR